METRFAGKTALVTGASRGIGLAIAKRLVTEGARVVITARDSAALVTAVEDIGGAEHAVAVAGPADDETHQREAVGRALDAFGSLDLLVKNAMLISMTQLLAVELAPSIRVNAVAPAVVKTQFAAGLYAGKEAEVAARYPLARLGAPEDVGGAVSFLLSEEAAWITGQTLVLDGGLTIAGLEDA